jgi:hypothetical protein
LEEYKFSQEVEDGHDDHIKAINQQQLPSEETVSAFEQIYGPVATSNPQLNSTPRKFNLKIVIVFL